MNEFVNSDYPIQSSSYGYCKDNEVQQLRNKLQSLTEKFNGIIYKDSENKNIIQSILEKYEKEKSERLKLIEENKKLQKTNDELQKLSQDLLKGVRMLTEQKCSPKDLNAQILITNKDYEKEIESIKKKHGEELDVLKRSNKVLKDLLQQQQTINQSPLKPSIKSNEDTFDLMSNKKSFSNMKSAQQNKFKSHRKSRSFGIGENLTSFKFGEFEKPNNKNFFLDFQKPLSPLKAKFTKEPINDDSIKNNNKSMKIIANKTNGIKELQSPITESKMNKLFGSSNISLVNMSRPKRGGFRKRKQTDSDLFEYVVKTGVNVNETTQELEFDEDDDEQEEIETSSSNSMSSQSDETSLETEPEKYDLKKVDYNSYDPHFAFTSPPKQQLNSFKQPYYQPSLASLSSGISSNGSNCNYASPKNFNLYNQPIIKQNSNHSINSNNSENLKFKNAEKFYYQKQNEANDSFIITNGKLTAKQESSGLFNRRQANNSNNLRKFF